MGKADTSCALPFAASAPSSPSVARRVGNVPILPPKTRVGRQGSLTMSRKASVPPPPPLSTLPRKKLASISALTDDAAKVEAMRNQLVFLNDNLRQNNLLISQQVELFEKLRLDLRRFREEKL